MAKKKKKAGKTTAKARTKSEVFGELALIDRETRSAGAKAITDCEILILTGEDLHRVFEMSHRIGYLVMHNTAAMLASRLRKTNLQLLASDSWK